MQTTRIRYERPEVVIREPLSRLIEVADSITSVLPDIEGKI